MKYSKSMQAILIKFITQYAKLMQVNENYNFSGKKPILFKVKILISPVLLPRFNL